MFRVNNKDTRTTSLASFWCLCCLLWTYFTPCSSVSIVNFEQVNADWEATTPALLVSDLSFYYLLGMSFLLQYVTLWTAWPTRTIVCSKASVKLWKSHSEESEFFMVNTSNRGLKMLTTRFCSFSRLLSYSNSLLFFLSLSPSFITFSKFYWYAKVILQRLVLYALWEIVEFIACHGIWKTPGQSVPFS